MSLFQDKTRFSFEITSDRSTEADASLLEGDGFLHRFAAALGIGLDYHFD